MPPKRKNKSEGKEETKKTKTSSATSSSGTQQGIGDWKKKSSEEFKIIPEGNKPSDDEWKIYYQKRKKAEEFHKKVLENDENLGMEQLIMEAIEKVVQANTKLTEGDKSKVLNQFLITQLEACFEDSDLDDLRSCTIVVTAYSDHSYSSIEFEFEYHFRVRGYGIEFFRSFKYATYDKPSTTPKKTVWYSNGAPSEYEEDRKFKLTLGQLLNMKELLFREIICERLSNYEFVKLTLESIAQFGETGNVKDDDWIGYHNRMLCGCPTKEDRDFVHPTSRISRLGVEQDYDKAMEWHLKSGSLAKSQYNIGVLFQNGQGVEKDYVKAFEWYLKAAENGDADAQYNIALLYEDGKGVGKDYSKAFEWYLKSAENGDTYAQFNIGLFYRDGIGVGKDYVKAFEWYLKSAKNGNKLGQFNVGCCYENGVSAEKDVKAALYWKAKGLNEIDFKFIGPYPEFGIEVFRNCANNDMKQITSETEQVIIRFEEKDFNVSHTLSSSKYLSTLMNSNWRNFNEKHDGRIILDLRSIQNEIFQEEGHHIQIFEIYLNYLTSDILPTDCELKLKLIELSRYLGDDECILQVMKESSILMRLYILFKFEMIEPIHIAIASCYVTESSESATLNIDDLSENILEVLLTQIQLSSLAKKEILNAFVKKFTNLSSSIVFSKLIKIQVQNFFR